MTSRRTLLNISNDELTAEQVLAHSQNNSSAKQQFSFPKAQRFSCKTQLSQYTFYPVPSTRTKISAVIGSQKRTLFDQKNNEMPAPDQYSYSVQGEFQLKGRRKLKGYYFGCGRSDIKINNFLGSDRGVPDPLKYYNPELASCLERREYSFSKERKFHTLRKNEEESVGPGSYKIDTSLDQQKQVLSSQFKSLCPKFQEVKVESRKRRLETQPPLYCPMVTAKGEMLKYGSQRGTKIGMSRRTTLAKNQQIPGPGQQQALINAAKMFSEFLSKGKA